MPLALVLLLLNAVFVVHAAKTGRFWPWAYVILLLPGFGALGYVVVELAPAWVRSPQGRQARHRISKRLNPEKRYGVLKDNLEVVDTIANRAALADECMELGRLDEAKQHYDHIIGSPLGEDPAYFVRKARAELGLAHPAEAVATLDDLRKRWPDYQSAEAHFLYARALEAAGRTYEALEEYRAVSASYPGAEPRARHGLVLKLLGHHDEARTVFGELLTLLKHAPKHVRRMQAEWIAIAERELRA